MRIIKGTVSKEKYDCMSCSFFESKIKEADADYSNLELAHRTRLSADAQRRISKWQACRSKVRLVGRQDLYSKTYILKNRPSLTVNRKNIYIKKQVLSQLFRTKASNSQDKTPQHSCDTDPLMQLVTLHIPFGLFPWATSRETDPLIISISFVSGSKSLLCLLLERNMIYILC